MNDAIYDRSLDIVSRQVKELIDRIDTSFLPERKLTPRAFDWDDINSYTGVSLRYVEDPEILSQLVDDTTESTCVGYPMIIVANWSAGAHRDSRRKKMRKLFQDIRHNYMHRRRLQDANETDVAMELSCTVRVGGPTPPAGFKLNKGVSMTTIIGWFMERRTLAGA